MPNLFDQVAGLSLHARTKVNLVWLLGFWKW